MTLTRYLKALRRMWPIVALTLLLGVGLGALSAAVMPKSYEASATIFVNPAKATSVQDLQMGEQFAANRAASYAAIGTSSEVLKPVSEQLGGEPLSDAVTVTNAPNTATLTVTGEDSDPQRAADIARLSAESLVNTAADLEGAKSPQDSPVRLSVVDQPSVPSSKASPSMSMNILVGAVVGLIVGLLIVLARAASARRETV